MNTRRILDIHLVVLLFPIWIIVFLIMSALKLLFDGFPLLYISTRCGKNKKPLRVYKFRTMVRDQDFIRETVKAAGYLGYEAIPLSSEVYTRAGKIFERLQLVEVPQFINIALGDMSFVGYRPLPLENVRQLEDEFGEGFLRERHKFSPGVTGFSQLSGKFNINPKERLLIEVHEGRFFDTAPIYLRITVYLGILMLTAPFVLFGSSKFVLKLRDKYIFSVPRN